MTHSIGYSDNWEFADWKGFQKVLFRLQRRIFKAIREEDKAKAKSLQLKKLLFLARDVKREEDIEPEVRTDVLESIVERLNSASILIDRLDEKIGSTTSDVREMM